MKINLIVKDFKIENKYSQRGNWMGALSLIEAFDGFKNFIESALTNKTNDTLKMLNAYEDTKLTKKELILLNEKIKAVTTELISTDKFSFDKITDESIFISYVQNSSHRKKVTDIIEASGKSLTTFDRSTTPDNLSNGFYFAKKYNKIFQPRFAAKKYLPNRDLNSIGVYLRPDVCPLQVDKLIKLITKTDDTLDTPTTNLPTIIVYGKMVEFDYPKIAYTNDPEEFFSTIGSYIYCPMEIDDPMHNTMIEAFVNKIPVYIYEDQETLEFSGRLFIEEMDWYLSNLNLSLPRINKLSDILDYDINKNSSKDGSTLSDIERISLFFVSFCNFSNFIGIHQIFLNIEKEFTFMSRKERDVLHLILNTFLLNSTYKDILPKSALMSKDQKILLLDEHIKLSPIVQKVTDTWIPFMGRTVKE